jgi:hypothetical protein
MSKTGKKINENFKQCVMKLPDSKTGRRAFWEELFETLYPGISKKQRKIKRQNIWNGIRNLENIEYNTKQIMYDTFMLFYTGSDIAITDMFPELEKLPTE